MKKLTKLLIGAGLVLGGGGLVAGDVLANPPAEVAHEQQAQATTQNLPGVVLGAGAIVAGANATIGAVRSKEDEE